MWQALGIARGDAYRPSGWGGPGGAGGAHDPRGRAGIEARADPRLPAPEKVLGDVQAWLATEHPDVVRSMRCDRNAAGDTELLLDLHPAADSVTITVSDVGRVVASADTSAVGPGYHTFVGRTLERAGDTQGIDWTGEIPASAPLPGGTGGATPDATAALRDRPSVERAHLAWLGRLLVRAREARHAGVTGLHLGTKAGVMYRFDGALATPLGPRGDAWLEQASADARVAIDLRPWWADTTDGRYLLNRALCLMWTEVRWRPPAATPSGRDGRDAARAAQGLPARPIAALPVAGMA